jgi:hypothetical protein
MRVASAEERLGEQRNDIRSRTITLILSNLHLTSLSWTSSLRLGQQNS